MIMQAYHMNEPFILWNGSAIVVDVRLKTIFEEASKLFISKGYARTQISFIANASGISVGAIYTLFTSKKAIFNFVLKCVIDSDYIESNIQLPVKESDFTALENDILEFCQGNNRNFEKHLNDSDDSYNFEQMLSDVFDILAKYGVGFLILQNNGTDCGAPYKNYVAFRKLFCKDVKKYVFKFMKQGKLRELEYPEYHARLIVETLSWWGMHIKYDAFETNPTISQEISKKVAVDALLHSYTI
jgi:AcrR family transcriptional regulator